MLPRSVTDQTEPASGAPLKVMRRALGVFALIVPTAPGRDTTADTSASTPPVETMAMLLLFGRTKAKKPAGRALILATSAAANFACESTVTAATTSL